MKEDEGELSEPGELRIPREQITQNLLRMTHRNTQTEAEIKQSAWICTRSSENALVV